ncbi:MAG: hypothetical protein GX777_09465, partial [Fastidiosipila sp.]|nr:hypothetical protein [Fastidiosipila sp.]
MKKINKHLKLFCLLLLVSLLITGCGNGGKTSESSDGTQTSGTAAGSASEPNANESGGNESGDEIVRLNVGMSSAPVNLNVWSNNDLNSALLTSIAMPGL